MASRFSNESKQQPMRETGSSMRGAMPAGGPWIFTSRNGGGGLGVDNQEKPHGVSRLVQWRWGAGHVWEVRTIPMETFALHGDKGPGF